MDHTIVHFEIPADDPERAAKSYRDLFGWTITKFEGTAGGIEYWMVQTVLTDDGGMPVRPGVNGGLMRRMYPGQQPVNHVNVERVDDFLQRAKRLAQLKDPDGNVFAIWEMDPAAGL